MSYYFIAPVVILGSIAAIIILLKWDLPAIVVNGFAIMGLAGALARIQRNPYYDVGRNDLKSN